MLIVDAAYADYVVADDFEPGQALVEAGSNTVMTRTFSKLYGLAGLRIGWMYGPANIVDAVERIRTPFSASADAMAAATAAVRDVRYSQFVRDYNNRASCSRIDGGGARAGRRHRVRAELRQLLPAAIRRRPPHAGGCGRSTRATTASSRGRSPPGAPQRLPARSRWGCSTRTMPCSRVLADYMAH